MPYWGLHENICLFSLCSFDLGTDPSLRSQNFRGKDPGGLLLPSSVSIHVWRRGGQPLLMTSDLAPSAEIAQALGAGTAAL